MVRRVPGNLVEIIDGWLYPGDIVGSYTEYQYRLHGEHWTGEGVMAELRWNG